MGEIVNLVEKFILDDLLFGDSSRMPAPDDSLIETGIIDSTGILELIEFLEREFDIRVDDTDTVPSNLDGIARICAFVATKRLGDGG